MTTSPPPPAPPVPAASPADRLFTPSAVVLVAANLVPLAGVLFFGWTVFATLLLFWVENAIVGVFNILRMLVATPQSAAAWAMKVFMIPFFTIHYGMFVTVHGLFVLALFGGDVGRGSPSLALFERAIQSAGIAPAAWGLALSHGASFAFNYVGAGQYRTAPLPALMYRPYGRVMVLHVVTLVGGFLLQLLGSPLIPLALLVVLKTGLDLFAHLREHASALRPAAEPVI
ncbi:MAG TPA: DUF6498-containing protein [Gemmatimonadales bacterium]|nr:DUF6498-containing protein [Gemmatimonadales bacterium]